MKIKMKDKNDNSGHDMILYIANCDIFLIYKWYDVWKM